VGLFSDNIRLKKSNLKTVKNSFKNFVNYINKHTPVEEKLINDRLDTDELKVKRTNL